MNQDETGRTTEKIDQSHNEPEALLKSWYCAALLPSGNVASKNTGEAQGILEMISTSVICWVDYVAQDLDKELPFVAGQFGFTPQLISELVGERRSTYRDFDIEMGMKMPSVQVTEFEVKPYPLFILLKKNLVITIHALNIDRRFIRLRRYSETILKKYLLRQMLRTN